MSEPGDPKPPPPTESAKADQQGRKERDGERKRRRRSRRARPGDKGEGKPGGERAGEGGSSADGSLKPSERARRRRSARAEARRRNRKGGADSSTHDKKDGRPDGRRRRRRRERGGEAESSSPGDATSATTPPTDGPADGTSESQRQAADGEGSTRRRRRRRQPEGRDEPRERRAAAREERRRRRRRRGRRGDGEGDGDESAQSHERLGDAETDAHLDPTLARPGATAWSLGANADGADGHDGPDGVRARAQAPREPEVDPDDDIVFDPPAPGPGPDPDDDDPDPVSFEYENLDVAENRALRHQVRNLAGVKFTSTGRIFTYDAGNRTYQRGDEVMVEIERGTRLGIIAVAPQRKEHSGKPPRRVLRHPNDTDRENLARSQARADDILVKARALAKELRLPIKVYRTALSGNGKKMSVYFTSEERIDFRTFVKRLTSDVGARIEMRQTGVRDEAKAVGGIGSCGMELCCTTWLPEFVPVSIKMAKDQGLVLNPTKVSGQCGRLKCCLVYEQDTYAAMRKGLPKLGKRVITEAGEGRVVEVDVLRQRVRVALGPGDFQVFPGDAVKPKFPSQQPKAPKS